MAVHTVLVRRSRRDRDGAAGETRPGQRGPPSPRSAAPSLRLKTGDPARYDCRNCLIVNHRTENTVQENRTTRISVQGLRGASDDQSEFQWILATEYCSKHAIVRASKHASSHAHIACSSCLQQSWMARSTNTQCITVAPPFSPAPVMVGQVKDHADGATLGDLTRKETR